MVSFLKISPTVIIKFSMIDKFEANPKDVSLYIYSPLENGNHYSIGSAHNNKGAITFPQYPDPAKIIPRCFRIDTRNQATSDYLLLRIIEECANHNGIFEIITNYDDPKDIFFDVRMCDSAKYSPKSDVALIPNEGEILRSRRKIAPQS